MNIPQTLPALRDDLEIMEGTRQSNGAPSWTLHDPVRQAFFRIGKREFDILRFWQPGSIARVAQQVSRQSSTKVDEAEVLAVSQFLAQNQLTRSVPGRELFKKYKAGKKTMSVRLLHNYLFFRLPLVKPDKFLDRSKDAVAFLYSRATLRVLVAMLIAGVLLTLRQWDQFIHSFSYLFSWQGIMVFACTLFFSKTIHELGHAYTAKRYGAQVTTMGVALLVLWPVLYTDTTDAWRLKSRRQRLAIAAAGIAAELGLAVVALLLWNHVHDGAIRSGLFVMCTATWVTTLLINANPFMRWDGYYLLSDLSGVENLQPRSFALAKWWLRKSLFGLSQAPPEHFSNAHRNGLIIYGVATWLYRFHLFLGIALLVYSFFFKLIGLFLMVVELWFFIGRPIAREISAWYRLKSRLRWNAHTTGTLLFVLCLSALLILPRHSRISAPAVIEPAAMQRIYPPFPARLEQVLVTEGDRVAADQPLFVLHSPDHAFNAGQAGRESAALLSKISRLETDERFQEQRNVLIRKWQEAKANLTGYQQELDKLSIRVPFPGRIAELTPDLESGVWLHREQALAVIADESRFEVHAYPAESDLNLIEKGVQAKYISDNPEIPITPLKVVAIDTAAMDALDKPMLSSLLGGDIAVRLDERKRMIPEASLYRVVLQPTGPVNIRQLDRGVVCFRGEQESLLYKIYRTVSAVIIRESGF